MRGRSGCDYFDSKHSHSNTMLTCNSNSYVVGANRIQQRIFQHHNVGEMVVKPAMLEFVIGVQLQWFELVIWIIAE